MAALACSLLHHPKPSKDVFRRDYGSLGYRLALAWHLASLAGSALSALWAVVVAGVGTFDVIVETASPKNGERISCWAPNSNDEGRETVPFGTDDCEGGDELGGLLGPRCQSRLSQPDDCSGPITVPRHGAISQFYWGFLEPENVVCG